MITLGLIVAGIVIWLLMAIQSNLKEIAENGKATQSTLQGHLRELQDKLARIESDLKAIKDDSEAARQARFVDRIMK